MKIGYIIIPLAVIIVASTGSFLTALGIDPGWYASIAKPSWTPDGSVIGAVWTTIFILTAISALLVWKKAKRDKRFYWIVTLLIANACLNVLWSLIFFVLHEIGFAVIEAALLDVTVIALMVLIWPISRIASLMLLPYAVWVAFASFLTYNVWVLNI